MNKLFRNNSYLVLVFLFSFNLMSSQTQGQKVKIKEYTNLEKLHQLSIAHYSSYIKDLKNLELYANINNIPLIIPSNNGGTSRLQKVLNDGTLIYIQTYNRGGASTLNTDELYTGGSLDLEVEGENITIGVWDGGLVRTSHELFNERVTQIDNASTLSDHATHVSGTLVGSGLPQLGNARGMAFKASLISSDFNNDLSEMSVQASKGLLISNHSYGFGATNLPLYYFGRYDEKARALDELLYNAPYYTVVVSAGNDRNAGFNPIDSGYDLLTDQSVSKNDITVAAVNEVSNYSIPSDVVMSNFSSWGPTDDGRIKPDISAKGVNMFSATATSDNSYNNFTGTSMSSPTVAGSLALLQELHSDLHGDFMKASTLKAIALHTASEAGSTPGPDYSFGWGLLNVEKGAEMILKNEFQSLIEENNLANGSVFTKTVSALTTEPLVVTIVWTDPAGVLQGTIEDDATPRIINDLDISVTGPSGTISLPWKLDPANPSAAATQGVNNVDNVEKIEIENPIPGNYTITINHKGTLMNSSQDYSLIISGIDEFDFAYTPDDFSKSFCDNEVAVYNFNYESSSNYNGPTNLSVSGLPAGLNSTITPSVINADQDFVLEITGLNNVAVGQYPFTINAVGVNGTKTKDLELIVNSSANFSNVALNYPANGENDVFIYPTLEWSSVSNAQDYKLEVSEFSDYNTIFYETVTNQTSLNLQGLSPNTQYFWRVKPLSVCVEGAFTSYNFVTEAINCFPIVGASDLPQAIATVPTEINSVINITDDFIIGDVNVALNITHSFLADLTVSLISPSGTEVVLFANACDDFNNANVTFDDNTNTNFFCTSPFFGITGTMKPQNPLAEFIGENSQGNWTLKVIDGFNQDGGSLNNFSLTFCDSAGPNLSISDEILTSFKLFPNPNKGEFIISFDSINNSAIRVDVYDLKGRSIYKDTFQNNSNKFNENINLNDVHSGIYIIKITQGNSSISRKIVVE